ncbi:MAG: rod shape-determining protein MreD [Limnochordales bacterium]|nr:rod shape-determining protein MreD [Limnochordales bacterium]
MRGEREARVSGWLTLGATLVGLLVVQLAFLPHLPLGGVRPELLLVFVLGVALQQGAAQGLLLGMIAGLLYDLPGGHLVGLSAAAYGVTGWAAGLVGERVYPDRPVVVLGVVAAGTLASQGVYLGGAAAFGLPWPPLEGFVRVSLTLVGYHLLLTPVVYPLSRWAGAALLARRGEGALDG